MLTAGTDVLPLVKPSSDAAVTSGGGDAKVEYFLILKVIHERGYYVGSLGVLPTWVWPVLKRIHPWYRIGGVAAANFAKLATTVVYQRLETPTDRVDIIGKLIEGKDDEGKPMERPELVGQTIAYLNAGTGTLPGEVSTIFNLPLSHSSL